MSVTLARIEPSIAGVGDYLALLKPRVISLVVFTALVGLVIAPGHVHPVIALTARCIAVGAGAAGALKCGTTPNRRAHAAHRRQAYSAGPRHPRRGGRFRVNLAASAMVTLGLLVNWLAAALLAFAIVFYVAISTMWLERTTPQNIVIGGAAGALPPIIGWRR